MTPKTRSKSSGSRQTAEKSSPSKSQPVFLDPQPGPQTNFLASPADIAIFGGAAGGGKTWSLLAEASRNVGIPEYGGVIFRRTVPQITNQGGLWDAARKMYLPCGADFVQNPHRATFPSGAKVHFQHLQHEKDSDNWLGSELPFIGFDQLESFTKRQFFDLIGRGRSTGPFRPYVRASCNPEPDHWLGELLQWWIDDQGDPIGERCGKLRWFITESDGYLFADTAEELKRQRPGCLPLSLTFIAAKLEDNKILEAADPGYRAKLAALPYARRRALLDGNWKTRPQGKMFKYEWFRWCQPEDVPDLVSCAVGCDPSGGHEAANDEQGIAAAGLARGGTVYVLADDTCKQTPQGWGTQTVATYRRHKAGWIAAEGNFGGEMVKSTIHNVDANANVRMVTASRGKAVRAEPIAALYEQGKVIHVGRFPELEAELVGFDPVKTKKSPNRMDALVWAITSMLDKDDNVLQYYRELAKKPK